MLEVNTDDVPMFKPGRDKAPHLFLKRKVKAFCSVDSGDGTFFCAVYNEIVTCDRPGPKHFRAISTVPCGGG